MGKPIYKVYQEVYLITDPDQYKRIVTGVLEQPKGYEYRLQCGTVTSWHFAGEISTSKTY